MPPPCDKSPGSTLTFTCDASRAAVGGNDLRWTKPNYVKYWYDADGTQVYWNRWENREPRVLMTGFRVPGAAYTDTALAAYTYPAYTPTCVLAGCQPYWFDTGEAQAGDFNGSGYSGAIFGFIEPRINTVTGVITYTRAETTLCLSTGRALDCAVRKKYSGANYMVRIHGVGVPRPERRSLDR